MPNSLVREDGPQFLRRPKITMSGVTDGGSVRPGRWKLDDRSSVVGVGCPGCPPRDAACFELTVYDARTGNVLKTFQPPIAFRQPSVWTYDTRTGKYGALSRDSRSYCHTTAGGLYAFTG